MITFPFCNELSAQKYPWCDADVTHHGTSHHMHNPEKIELITKINVFHMQHFAYMLEKLDAIKEGNGSILDNSLIAYGSGVSDGDRHNHDNLPTLLLGKEVAGRSSRAGISSTTRCRSIIFGWR